jgi:hypothetical protein
MIKNGAHFLIGLSGLWPAGPPALNLFALALVAPGARARRPRAGTRRNERAAFLHFVAPCKTSPPSGPKRHRTGTVSAPRTALEALRRNLQGTPRVRPARPACVALNERSCLVGQLENGTDSPRASSSVTRRG